MLIPLSTDKKLISFLSQEKERVRSGLGIRILSVELLQKCPIHLTKEISLLLKKGKKIVERERKRQLLPDPESAFFGLLARGKGLISGNGGEKRSMVKEHQHSRYSRKRRTDP